MITSGELINSRSVKCLLSSCYVLETVLDHHRQSSCSEGFSHGSRGLAQWGGPLGFRQEELYHAFWARTFLVASDWNLIGITKKKCIIMTPFPWRGKGSARCQKWLEPRTKQPSKQGHCTGWSLGLESPPSLSISTTHYSCASSHLLRGASSSSYPSAWLYDTEPWLI